MTRCVLDSDVVIAVLDRTDAHHRRAGALITTLADSEATLMLSLVNYAETLMRPAFDDQTCVPLWRRSLT